MKKYNKIFLSRDNSLSFIDHSTTISQHKKNTTTFYNDYIQNNVKTKDFPSFQFKPPNYYKVNMSYYRLTKCLNKSNYKHNNESSSLPKQMKSTHIKETRPSSPSITKKKSESNFIKHHDSKIQLLNQKKLDQKQLFNSGNNSLITAFGNGKNEKSYILATKLRKNVLYKPPLIQRYNFYRPPSEKASIVIYKNQMIPEDNIPYIDPLFPPKMTSLLGTYNPESLIIREEDICWVRLHELFDNDLAITNTSSLHQEYIPNQGWYNNSNVISSMIALAQQFSLISKLMINLDVQTIGCYKFIFKIKDKPCIVLIDDFIPCFKGTKCPIFARGSCYDVWPMLLEKALAKVAGSYCQLQNMTPYKILTMTTRFSIKTIDFPYSLRTSLDDHYKAIKTICSVKNNQRVIIGKIDSNLLDQTLIKNNNRIPGLILDSYYLIKGIHEKTINGRTYSFVQIKSPINHHPDIIKYFLQSLDCKRQIKNLSFHVQGINEYDFEGDYSREAFSIIPKHDYINDYHNGIFYMSLKDFALYYNSFTYFNYVRPLYSAIVDLPLNRMTAYTMIIENKCLVSFSSILDNHQTNIELILIMVKNEKDEKCFKIINNNNNSISNQELSLANYVLFVYVDNLGSEGKMISLNIISTGKLGLDRVKVNQSLHECFLKKIGRTIIDNDGNNSSKPKMMFNLNFIKGIWPYFISRSRFFFVLIQNMSDKEITFTIEWNLYKCLLVDENDKNEDERMLQPKQCMIIPLYQKYDLQSFQTIDNINSSLNIFPTITNIHTIEIDSFDNDNSDENKSQEESNEKYRNENVKLRDNKEKNEEKKVNNLYSEESISLFLNIQRSTQDYYEYIL